MLVRHCACLSPVEILLVVNMFLAEFSPIWYTCAEVGFYLNPNYATSPGRLLCWSPRYAWGLPRNSEGHSTATCFLLVIRWYDLRDCSRLVWVQVNAQHRCKIVAVGECVVLFMTQQDWSSHVHELGGSKAYLNCHPNGTWTHIGHGQNLNIELFIVLGGYYRTHNRGRARTKDEGGGKIKTFGQRRGGPKRIQKAMDLR